MPTTSVCVVSIIFIYYMRCGVAQSVTRVGDTSPSHCCNGIGYLLARSLHYSSFAVTYPSDVILVSHILSIQWCAARARRIVLPIRRSVRTMRWSTPPTRAELRCALHERDLFNHTLSIPYCLCLLM